MINSTTHKKILESVDRKIIKQSKIKNILITGCGGFIGNYLVSALLSKTLKGFFKIYGYDIIAPKLDRNVVNKNNFFFKKVDLTKKKSFFLNKNIDLIIHLAGIPSPKYYKRFPLKTFYLNSDLCRILLDFAKLKKAKFISNTYIKDVGFLRFDDILKMRKKVNVNKKKAITLFSFSPFSANVFSKKFFVED